MLQHFKNAVNDMRVEKLKSILNLMPNIFYDEAMLKNALGRVFSDDKRARNILFTVIESGIIDNALLAQFVNESTYEIYVDTLYNDYGIEKSIAKDYIEYWLEALNIPYEDLNIDLSADVDIEMKSAYYDVDEKEQAEEAIRSLSRGEMEAAIHLLHELGSTEGILVASQIADRYGITRSVIVNALKKLEIAKMLESRSMGMKGIHIVILNTMLPKVAEEYRKKSKLFRAK